jgi:hypothetical protein
MTLSTAHDWRVAVRPAATTLSPARDLVVAYDFEGRPTSWFRRGETFKRSLASDVVGRRTVDGDRRRWSVAGTDADELLELARTVAAEARAARTDALVPDDASELDARLTRILAWTPERLRAERERFLAAYAPISILPPDQYEAVVLQATFGCSWNRCTYCTFYQGRPFQVRPPEAFAPHVEAVAELLGRAAAGRRRLFLADGNALVLSNERLRPIFETARATFPDRPVAGFVDVFSGERKSADAWRELRSWGLQRVAIGVETGHDPLLAYLNKPGGADEAAAFVRTLKEAGLEVAVIVMVGAGGRRYAEGHVRDTAALLERLPLAEGDLVYLSPFVRQDDAPYARIAERDGLEDLTVAERDAQDRALRRAARTAVPDARVARYHIDEFVY